MAYVLGFLYADGNIIKTKRSTHFVAGYSRDKDLIEFVRDALGSQHKVSVCVKRTGVYYKIQIGSRELFDDLCALGLTPNKSKRMRLPQIPARYVGDFIRGYFDGDGNVWSGFARRGREGQTPILQAAFTSGSILFLEDLLIALARLGLVGGSIYRPKKGNYGRLSFGSRDALKLRGIMYNVPCGFFLVRKRAVFERFEHVPVV